MQHLTQTNVIVNGGVWVHCVGSCVGEFLYLGFWVQVTNGLVSGSAYKTPGLTMAMIHDGLDNVSPFKDGVVLGISWVVPLPSNSGKWRFIGIPYWKWNNPGGDCYLEGGYPKVSMLNSTGAIIPCFSAKVSPVIFVQGKFSASPCFFYNPSEKYARQIGKICPNFFGVKRTKNIGNHHAA